MADEIQNIEKPFLEGIKKNAGLTVAMGVLLMLLGFLAIGSPFVAGLSIAMMVGVMLVMGGVGQLVFAVKTGKGLFPMVLGILTVIIGGYMAGHPGVALASLTLFLAAYLVISGIFEILMSFYIRPAPGWGWAFFGGMISVLLGAMIWSQYPLSDVWAVGILVGVKLLFSGWTLLILGFAAQAAAQATLEGK